VDKYLKGAVVAHMELWRLTDSSGGLKGVVVAHRKKWWLTGRCFGRSSGGSK
jgi:hypothetical protein